MTASPSIPGFTLHGELGEGGQATIYRAIHEASGRPVALKVLRDRGPGLVKRFHQEARVLAALWHPHLLRVFDHGEHAGVSYLAIELVEGEDLRQLVARDGPPPPDWIGRTLATIALTLQYCHESGVVHRDLKPANIVVERSTQRPVLVDFGLVKRDASLLTLASLDAGSLLSSSGDLLGTPEYMSPEQVNPDRFGQVSPRTDVYALGATLYHLLTGRPPFRGSASVLTLRKVTSKAPQDPREINATAAPALAELCLRCLSKQPADRPATAAELAALLTEAARIPAIPDPRTRPVDPTIHEAAAHLLTSVTELDRSAARGDPPARAVPRPGEEFADYTIVRELARGSGGAVFLASKGDEQRALKVLFGGVLDDTALERFQREFEAGRDLQHPNVVRVFDHGVEGGVAWLSMEYLEDAVPIDRFVFDRALRMSERLRLMEQLADAIQAAHQAGIVHRDLKPANVLVLPRGQVKVIDFGLARHVDRWRMTLSGRVMGTVSYMAPEQVRGHSAHADARTDVYSLGVILYQLIRGELPFLGDTNIQVMAAILVDTPPPPCQGVEGVPSELDDVVRMAMAKDPQDRYPSAAAFGRDLAAACSGSGHVSAVEHSLEARRRRRLGRWLLGAVCAVALVAGGSWWSARPTWFTAEQVQAGASALGREASDLLHAPGFLDGDRELVAELEDHLATLRAGVPPEEQSHPRLWRATARVVAVRGLAALAAGEETDARSALAQLEGDTSPAADALRGALRVEDDPAEAVRLLSRALARGIARAEVHRWRARALVRAGLTGSSADDVLADLAALRAAGGALAIEDLPLEVWAQIAKGSVATAQSLMNAVPDPPLDLRWAVGLEGVAPLLAEIPSPSDDEAVVPPLVVAVDALAALPPLPRPLPVAERLAEEAKAQLVVLSRRNLAASQEAHALGLLRLLRMLAPDARLPEPVAGDLIERAVGMLKPNVSDAGIKLGVELAAGHPDVVAFQNTVASKVQVVRSIGNKLRLLPIVRRAAKITPDPQRQRSLKRLLVETLAYIGERPGGEEQAEECLRVGSALLAIEERARRRAWIHFYMASARAGLGDTHGALEEMRRAFALHHEKDFLHQRATLLRMLDQDPEQALDDAYRYLEDRIDFSYKVSAAVVHVWELGPALGRPELVRAALEKQVSLRPENPGWRLRLAWWLIREGQPAEAARPHVREAANWAARPRASWDWWVKEDRSKRLEELAKLFEQGAPGAVPALEAFVKELETERKTPRPRTGPAGHPPTNP